VNAVIEEHALINHPAASGEEVRIYVCIRHSEKGGGPAGLSLLLRLLHAYPTPELDAIFLET
jgi:hypothetical protein